MKKIFTLLIALGLLTVADAQRGNKNRHPKVGVSISVGNNGIYQSNFAADRLLRQELARINFKYDRRIRQVRNNYFMFRFEKMRKISRLEQQRQQEINRAYAKARITNNRYGNKHRRF